MIELRENSVAIVHRGLGYDGQRTDELVVKNWNTKWVSTIEIISGNRKCSMTFDADELIAFAEIFKQLRANRR